MNPLKQLRDDLVKNTAAQKALKKEGRELMALAEPTPDQQARIPKVLEELTALETTADDLTQRIADLERVQETDARQPATQVVMGKNHAEEKPVSWGEFLQGVAYQRAPELAARAGYVWQPHIQAAVSGASSGVSADGGALVRTDWSTALLTKAQENSKLLPKCDQLPIGDGFDGIEAPYINETSRATGSRWGGVQVYRTPEAGEATAKKTGLGKFELRLEDLKGLFYATDRVLRDATLLEAITSKAFASEFAFKIDDEILRGTGNGQCLGILNADCKVQQAKETGQTADTIKAENVIKMHARLLARNMGGAEWYINQEALQQLQTMSVAVGSAGGQLVYMPPGGLSTAPYGTLLGRPVNVLEQCAGLGDEGDIIFADFGEYLVISKGMTSASSMHVRFIYDEMTFRWTWPINGKPKLASAITPYKATTATTLSPFVTLQAR